MITVPYVQKPQDCESRLITGDSLHVSLNIKFYYVIILCGSLKIERKSSCNNISFIRFFSRLCFPGSLLVGLK